MAVESGKPGHLDRIAEARAARKQHVYRDLLRLTAGDRVLDVGSGVGVDTTRMARLVGNGLVVGLDMDRGRVREANARADEQRLRARHIECGAGALAFEDGTFDACHSERVFMHLPDAEATFAEMVRVTKPGGRIVVIEGDGASHSIDTTVPDIERRIMPFWIHKQANGYAGRELYRFFRRHGMSDIAVEIEAGPYYDLDVVSFALKLKDVTERAVEAGAVTRDEAQRFRADIERASAEGAFFATFNLITVAGRTPG